jgi:hypothetical protein
LGTTKTLGSSPRQSIRHPCDLLKASVTIKTLTLTPSESSNFQLPVLNMLKLPWREILATVVMDRKELENEKFPKWFSQALAARIIRAHNEEGICSWSKCRSKIIDARQPSSHKVFELPMGTWVMDVFIEVYLLVSQSTSRGGIIWLTVILFST